MAPDIKFALVILDVDLFKPTMAGLQFFYPRLSAGGILIVHDYNFKWAGLMKAVDEFVACNNLYPVYIPDKDGSVVLQKPMQTAMT
jgi:O-methyltransferase